jgi:hypothetical protein
LLIERWREKADDRTDCARAIARRIEQPIRVVTGRARQWLKSDDPWKSVNLPSAVTEVVDLALLETVRLAHAAATHFNPILNRLAGWPSVMADGRGRLQSQNYADLSGSHARSYVWVTGDRKLFAVDGT